jgi:hypothetical protein
MESGESSPTEFQDLSHYIKITLELVLIRFIQHFQDSFSQYPIRTSGAPKRNKSYGPTATTLARRIKLSKVGFSTLRSIPAIYFELNPTFSATSYWIRRPCLPDSFDPLAYGGFCVHSVNPLRRKYELADITNKPAYRCNCLRETA